MTLGLVIGLVVGASIGLSVALAAARRRLRQVRDAERRARAAEHLAEVGMMTGGLAHEIKNPLSTIGLNVQLLAEALDELPADPDAKGRLLRRCAALSREVERLRGILADFLQYAGELHLDPRPADLNAVVGELADFFMPQAESQGVRLRIDLAPGPLPAMLDVSAVKQAVLNLMLNAVQAMTGPRRDDPQSAGDPASPQPPSRELILRTASGKAASRRSGPTPRPGPRGSDRRGSGSLVSLHVIDTGPGMDPETLAKAFRPYFTTKAGGSGLGLPTARRIIEGLGGTIEVHSEPGRGTEFVVRLPGA